MNIERSKDLQYNGTKITVLREFGGLEGNSLFCVCQGDSFAGEGLDEVYQEFENYTDAVTYFKLICK